MSCDCHIFNLTVSDKSLSFVKVVSFFDVMRCLSTLFSSSTKGWKILLDNF